MQVEGDMRRMQINFGGCGIFGFSDFCPYLFAYKAILVDMASLVSKILHFLFAKKWPNFPSDHGLYSSWGQKIESAHSYK